MTLTSEQAKKIIRVRHGDRFKCRVDTIRGVRVARCNYNGEEMIGRGKDTSSAIRIALTKLNGI